MKNFGDSNPHGDPMWYQGHRSPYYNKSHEQLRSVVRDTFEDGMIPYIHDWDEAGEIPLEFRVAAYSTGMAVLACGHPFPTEYGPALPAFLTKPDIFHAITIFQEMSRGGSIGVGWGLGAGLCIGLPPVLTFGSAEMKARVAPDVLAGRKMICLAVTEPTAGSDVANIKTTAKREGDVYIVNGEKKWITNGIWADFFTVAVRTGGEGMGGISLLLLEKSMPGITCRKMKCSGVWCSGTTYITMENVRVPVANLIGKENKGFKYIVHNFNHERVIICAQAIASARCCYEEAWKHAQRRKTFGKPLIEHQVIRFKLGEMIRNIESCQYWLDNLAYQVETMHHKEGDYKLGGTTALLKVQCTKVLEFCVRESCQIFGGLSFSRGGMGEKVERLSREVRSLAIPGGSEEIMIDLGIRMSHKIAQLGHQMTKLAPPGEKSPFGKQIEMAKRAGVNVEIFGDGNPFADPSWYQTYNSVFYNESHKRVREWIRNLEINMEGSDKKFEIARIVPLYNECILGVLVSGNLAPSCLKGVQVDAFHQLVVIDELARTCASGGIFDSIYSPFFDLLSKDHLAAIVAGTLRVACTNLCEVVAGDSGQISGSVSDVKNGMLGHKFVVLTANAAFLIDRSHVRITPIDGPFDSVDISFANAPTTLLTNESDKLETLTVRQQWVASIVSMRFARICYEEAFKLASFNQQGVRFKLGEMARQIEGAFAWLEALTYQLNAGLTTALAGDMALLKIHSTKLFEYCSRESSQILGALAYTRGNKVERLNREARSIALTCGNEETLLELGIRKIQKLGAKKHNIEKNVVPKL